jgi:mono/diheme cytochrome c family protein
MSLVASSVFPVEAGGAPPSSRGFFAGDRAQPGIQPVFAVSPEEAFAMKALHAISALLFAVLLPQTPSATDAAAGAPLVIPANAASVPNPVKPTPETLAFAKKMYGYDCAMCHGVKGDGKGDMVESMKLTMKDFTNPATLTSRTDGELFWVIKNGFDQMPGESGRQTDAQIWNMVLYLRTFSK